jgi:catechol 2,3-dioxygenase-like lactoylglutathione lyase family enzyme
MIKIRHVGIVTKNLKKSLYFWCDLLNFEIKKNILENGDLIDKVLGYKNVKVQTIKLQDGFGNLIEILYFYNPPKTKNLKKFPYSLGYTHISITVKNIQKIYKKLIKNKIKFNSKPTKSSDGKVIMTYCATPENGYLELVEEI